MAIVAGKARRHPEGYARDILQANGGGNDIRLATVYAGDPNTLEFRASVVVKAFRAVFEKGE